REVKIEGQGHGVVDVRGTIDASNAEGRGGSVKILGEKVALNGAHIDASGATGGGDVMLGGDFQGHGSDRNADRTFISGDTTIKADATTSGDGGNVVVWSNQVTGYNGHISARGGAQGGNGGNVEVSGKQNLMFRGTVDISRGGASASSGGGRGSESAQQAWRDGTLLLDPRDITIVASGGANNAEVSDSQV